MEVAGREGGIQRQQEVVAGGRHHQVVEEGRLLADWGREGLADNLRERWRERNYLSLFEVN